MALMWKNADQIDPIQGRNPVNYGWKISENGLEADWFSGHQIPESLTDPVENEENMTESACEDYEDSESAWSEESDDGEDEENI